LVSEQGIETQLSTTLHFTGYGEEIQTKSDRNTLAQRNIFLDLISFFQDFPLNLRKLFFHRTRTDGFRYPVSKAIIGCK
jgi:hypothetical protein